MKMMDKEFSLKCKYNPVDDEKLLNFNILKTIGKFLQLLFACANEDFGEWL